MTTIKATKYNNRFLARIIIEAKTPLAIGSGEKDITTDALVATDVNGLPYIPGTAIAGAIRNMIGKGACNDFFGFREGKKGKGSEVIFTEAKILNSEGKVIDGLDLKAKSDSLLKEYEQLPIRQHVKINDRGVAVENGKFDEQIVFAGTRFCFEIEMLTDGKNEEVFNSILSQIQSNTFRLGGGTRSGFGEVEIIDLQKKKLNLENKEELKLYLDKKSILSNDFWREKSTETIDKINSENWIEYKLNLRPDDFFLFGSGFGDDEVDITPVKGRKVEWTSGKGKLIDNLVLIPATSVKGALSHRVAFHYNKLKERYVGNSEAKSGDENEAVKILFGFEDQQNNKQKRGNLIFSDVIEQGKDCEDKIHNHVAIDRFTGGAIDGALFSEKTTYGNGKNFEITILANEQALKQEEEVENAFENALKDICTGILPLGGGVNRGHGIFIGSITKNGELL